MISGLVLAGGEAKRMSGVDKALVEVRGRPLIVWALDAIAPLSNEVLVARGPVERPRLALAVGERARLVADDGRGPASGLRAAAARARGEWVLAAPCDAPRLDARVYESLLLAGARREGAVAVAEGVVNPLVGAYRRDPLRAALVGVAAPRDAIAKMDVALVEVAADALFDVDTVADLDRA